MNQLEELSSNSCLAPFNTAFSRKPLIGDRKYELVLNFDVYARRKLWEHQRAGKRRYPRAHPTSMTTVVTTPVTIKLIAPYEPTMNWIDSQLLALSLPNLTHHKHSSKMWEIKTSFNHWYI